MTQEFTEQLAKWEMHMHQLGYHKRAESINSYYIGIYQITGEEG